VPTLFGTYLLWHEMALNALSDLNLVMMWHHKVRRHLQISYGDMSASPATLGTLAWLATRAAAYLQWVLLPL
jgi:aminopeptidase-like protein